MSEGEKKDLYDTSGLAGNDGMTQMVIFAHNGKVIQRFARSMEFIAYDPKNLADILNRFLGAMKEAGHTPVLNMPRRKITKAQRDALITRALHVYRSMNEKGRPPAVVAQHVVDSVLSASE